MARRLLIRPGAIGDFIVSLPALEHLRDDYTEVWAATPNVALARFADRARTISSVGLDRLGIHNDGDVVERLQTFDSIHSWYGAARADLRERVERAGLPFTFYDALPAGDGHAVDFYLAQVGAAPGALPRVECRLARRGETAILHPFASSLAKRWEMDKFQRLGALLEGKMAVRWCRGPEEELEGAFFQENLYELGTSLATAAVYVGNDSGISHLAAAVGTPVVALFGPTDARRWAPRGPSVTVLEMNSDPETVFQAAMDAAFPGTA